jgi:hypothetical protein
VVVDFYFVFFGVLYKILDGSLLVVASSQIREDPCMEDTRGREG